MKNWTIKKQLSVGFGATLVITLILGIASMIQNGMINSKMKSITKDSLPGYKISKSAQFIAQQYRVRNLKFLVASDKVELDELDRQANEKAQEFLDACKKYEKTISSSDDREIFAKINPLTEEYRSKSKEMRRLKREGKEKEADALSGPVALTYDALNEQIDKLAKYNESLFDQSMESISVSLRIGNIFLIFAVIGAVIGAVGITLFIVRSLSGNLKSVAHSLALAAEQAASASGQVSSSSQTIAQGANEQAAALEETSSSLEEMASMTSRNTENADRAKNLAREANEASSNGTHDMEEMMKAMAAIKESSSEISKIIKTIDEIAFQTNILALNAAVEAARAGDAGLGFAVVADEVRNLAQRSALSAKETADKIEQALQRTDRGVKISEKVAASLNEILSKSKNVVTLAEEVSNASREQTQGISQINTAVSQMDKVTQSNAANAEETASASEELNAQTQELLAVVARLNTLVGTHQDSKTVETTIAVPQRKPFKSEKPTPPVELTAREKEKSIEKLESVQSSEKPRLNYRLNGHSKSRDQIPLESAFKDF